MTVSYNISHYFFIFQIRWMLWNLFGTECRWLHILLSLRSIVIYLQPPLFTSQSVFSDTWSTASTISCWSSWFPSYLRTTSRGACCRLSPGAQRSCWHKREGKKQEQEWRSQCSSSSDQFCNLTLWSSASVRLVYEHYDISAPDEGIPGDDEKPLSSFEVPLEAPARL